MSAWPHPVVAILQATALICAVFGLQGQHHKRRTRGRLDGVKPRRNRYLSVGARLRQHRNRRKVSQSLPSGLEAISRSLRSGASLPGSLIEASQAAPGPLGEELTHMANELRLGRPLSESLDGFMSRQPLPDVQLASAALGLAMETGGARSRALDGLAQSIRDRQALRHEVQALASQARLSALVMAILPVGFLLITAATDDAVARLLTTTRMGAFCLAGGLVLDVGGLFWMHAMVRRA